MNNLDQIAAQNHEAERALYSQALLSLLTPLPKPWFQIDPT
jgi:hypothetical protein